MFFFVGKIQHILWVEHINFFAKKFADFLLHIIHMLS